MEKIELGSYTVAKSWDDVTLKMWSDYLRKINETENKQIDLIELLETFSDIPKDIIYQMPTDLFEKVMTNLDFLTNDELNNIQASSVIEVDGEKYQINAMEKLSVKEYLDSNTIIENDKFNYSALFAILCRKPNEEYNDEFNADYLEQRINMFDNIPISKAYSLIAFFLNCYVTSVILSQNSSMVDKVKEDLIKLVEHIENLHNPMVFSMLSHPVRIMTIKKLKKSIKAI